MSIFLENKNIVKNESKTANTFSELRSINESCLNFNEAAAYSEIAWQNIMINSMNEEYNIITENAATDTAVKVKDAIKNFFIKVAEFCKNLFIKIKNWFKDTFIKIKTHYSKIEKFATENEKKIMEGAKDGTKVTSISDWKGGNIAEPVSIGNILTKKGFNDTDANAEKFNEVYNSFIQSEELKEIKINTGVAQKAIKIAKTGGSSITYIGARFKEIENLNKKLSASANKGLSTNDEEQASKLKEEVTKEKNNVLKASKATSLTIRLMGKAMKDAHKINCACVKSKKEKTDKKEK